MPAEMPRALKASSAPCQSADSFLTPPFGWALFFCAAWRRRQITPRHIYFGIVPFVALQALGVVLVFYFPAIATWLPKPIGW